jgi:hypothetical protein
MTEATGDASRPGSAFSLSPALHGGGSPLLDLVIDRADPRVFSEIYLQVGSLVHI